MPRKTKNLAEVIRKKLQSDTNLADAVAAERFNVNVGAEIYRVRTEAGLSQGELADRIGTHQSVIARLEDADYAGHSLKMLRRIADALDQSVRVAFIGQSALKKRPAVTAARRKRPAARE